MVFAGFPYVLSSNPGWSPVNTRNGLFRANPTPSSWTADSTYGSHNYVNYLCNSRQRGFFAAFFFKNFSAIIDGLSNTVAVSEAVAIAQSHASAEQGSVRNIKGGGAAYLGTDRRAIINAGPQGCLNRRDSSNPTLVTGLLSRVNRCLPVTDGLYTTSGFVTSLPPNSPSCAGNVPTQIDDLAQRDTTDGMMSATSMHSGGVNVLMGDGAVKFVSDTVNCGTLNVAPVIDGPSKYGIWGGAGTTNGGETVTL